MGLERDYFDIERWWSRIGLTILVFAVVSVLVFPEFREFLNRNTGAFSALLTLFLVLLYFGQYRLQNRQLRLANRPAVDIQTYEEDGSYLEVWLSNLGNGVATDLRIETRVDFEENDDVGPAVGFERLRKVGEDGDRKRSVGNSLRAGEHRVKFVGEPKMCLKLRESGRTQNYGLSAGIGRLARADVEKVRFRFYIVNSDLLENEYRESVYGAIPWTIELEQGMHMGIEELKLQASLEVREDSWEDF